jgi:AraC family transcriptional regulator of adaptative response/methylated-DNA-[protein]-cysteine methyltransferase
MINLKTKNKYYKALLEKKSEYEGLFYVGVKTTGIFCRPTCPAKKPKFENCEFFTTAKEALSASFRPCKRCKPLLNPNGISEVVKTLVDAVEKEPEKRWKDKDFRDLSIDATTARRQFKKRFGMTFVEYARSRRIGIAMKEIRNGNSIIETQITTGYESSSGFRDAFSKIMGVAPTQIKNKKILKASWLDTKLGPMLAIGDEKYLYLLEFVDRRGLEKEIERLRSRLKIAIIPGISKPIISIKNELNQYFSGTLKEFKTPIELVGSSFQQSVWKELRNIPLGVTKSYGEIARLLGKPSAFRAVANANGANQLAIIVPCHRVINTNGKLGGYAGGLSRKQWMLELEKNLK